MIEELKQLVINTQFYKFTAQLNSGPTLVRMVLVVTLNYSRMPRLEIVGMKTTHFLLGMSRLVRLVD